MKKMIAWFLILAMTAAISIGATLAYLTSTDEDVNVMTVGNVKIEQLEYERIDEETENENAEVQEFQDNKPLYPAVTEKDFDYTTGDSVVDWEQIGKDGYSSEIWDPEKINNEIDKMVFVKNKGSYDAYVRTVFAFEAAPDWTFEDFQSKVHLNLNADEDVVTWEWIQVPVSIGEGTYFVAVATYNDPLQPGAISQISLSQVALDKAATNEDMEALGETYNVLVKSQAIQADGFANAVVALNDGFGAVTASAVPFTTDQPIQGKSLRNALRFYQGDETQPIHTQVTEVVYGLKRDHADIVNNYTGTLVTDEQNSEVYVYYVQEDGKYTVYFLSNGQIYLPVDSSRLFQEMAALTKVDTSNLNTSRVELMNHLFYKCSALAEVDVSGFDTSKVTTMKSMFNTCSSLTSVDVSKWDTSKVTDMSYMFRNLNVEELDLTGLDLDSATDISYMFSGSTVKKVNTTGWDTESVTTTRGMFMNCYALEEITGSGAWYLPNNTDMYYMFQKCYPLETLDVSNWDCSNVTTMQGTFFQCTGLKTVTGIGNWDTSKVTTMYGMFNNDYNLTSLEGIGNWDTGNVEIMSFLFWNCHSLPELDIGSWNTGKVKEFNSMFSGSGHNAGEMIFTHLPVENWDVSSAVNMECMFYGCGQLTELDLSKWNVSKVQNMRHIFADCFKVEKYNFTGWNTASLLNLDGIFNSNKALKSVDVSDFDTVTVTNFAQVFDGCTALEEIIGLDQWDTSNGTNFGEFLLGTQMVAIDLSSFDMSSAKTVLNMFHVNPKLTTIYVGDNWNLNPATLSSPNGMFGSSGALRGGNGSSVSSLGSNSAIYARVDTPETPGLLTHINDKPVAP